ncbi:cadherin domain protein, partial [Ostertagia ostertagi]
MTLSPNGKLAIAYLGDGLLRVQTLEPNKDPTDILLSSNTIAESPDYGPDGETPEGYYSFSNALIGTLSAVDANATDSFTYELVNDAGGALRLEGTQLRWSWSSTHRPDYETQSSYGIQVKVTDSAGRSFIKDLDIDVTDVNEAVTGYTAVYASGMGYGSIEENTAPDALIATLSGIDPDVDETFTFALLNGGGLPFEFAGNQLKLTGPVDAEVQSYYDLTVRIMDSAGHTVDRSLYLSVADIDDAAPTDIQLDDLLWYNGPLDEIAENTPTGTLIGYVNATDPDSYAYRGDFTF